MKILKIILILINVTIFASCLPKPVIAPSKIIANMDLNKDIAVYKNDFVNLDMSKVYEVDGKYYFGNFYYAFGETIYALDVSNRRIIMAGGNNMSHIPLYFQNMDNSKIALIDESSNMYITMDTIRYIGNTMITNRTINIPSDTPIIEGNDIPQSKMFTVMETNTNYIKVGSVSLSKISPLGNDIFNIEAITENEYESIIKIISITNSRFAVIKRQEDRMPVLDIYNATNGKIENRFVLSGIENSDADNMSYSKILDCVYIPDRNIIAILVMNVEKGKHKDDVIYSFKPEYFDIKEEYRIPSKNNTVAIGITPRGTVIYSGMENGNYFFIKSNPFISQNSSKEYIDLDDLQNIRGIKIFNDSIYGFMIKNNIITFYNY